MLFSATVSARNAIKNYSQRIWFKSKIILTIFNKSYFKKESNMSIYMGLRLKTNGVHWDFKDLVQTKFR